MCLFTIVLLIWLAAMVMSSSRLLGVQAVCPVDSIAPKAHVHPMAAV